MPFDLTWPGSELRDLVVDGQSVRLRLSAAAVQGGWLSGVTLTFAEASLHGDAAQAFGRVAEGAMREGTRDLPRLPMPGTLSGDVALILRMANGAQVVVRAGALAATLADDARFTEDLSC